MHRVTIVLAACILAVGGCATKPPEIAVPPPPSFLRPEPPGPVAPPVAPPVDVPVELPVGRSVEGRAVRCSVHGYGRETVLILGGIHGNEPASAVLCEQLGAYLDRHPELLAGLRVVIAPATNPDGLAAGRRTNARGVDLNRNFATSNRQAIRKYGLRPLSEPESRFIAELMTRFRPVRMVTVHQPLACVDYDGPARGLAEAMARACGLPVKKLGARPGSLGSFAGLDRRIPIVTLELPKAAGALSAAGVWRIYGRAMLVAVRYGTGAK